MKNLILAIGVIFLLNSCRKSDCFDNPVQGVFSMSIRPIYNDEDFSLNEIYDLNDTLKIRVESLKFYLSMVNPEPFEDESIDFFEGTETSFSFNQLSGNYNEISFHLGLDSAINHSDPSLYGSDHPLSSFNNMHWSWAQGYKFVIIEGKFDSDGDNMPDQSFSYHIGNDSYLKTVSLLNEFQITENTSTQIILNFDVKKIFEGIDISENTFTHSTSQFELVEQIATNTQNAFSID